METKDDFYDPELPLQSPDRDSIKSPSKDKVIFDSVVSPLHQDSPKVLFIFLLIQRSLL